MAERIFPSFRWNSVANLPLDSWTTSRTHFMRNALRPRAIRRLPRLLSLFLSRFTDARSLPYPLGLFLHPPCSCVSVRTRGTRRFFLSFAAARANSWHRRSPLRMIHRSRAAIAAHASFHHLFFTPLFANLQFPCDFSAFYTLQAFPRCRLSTLCLLK